MNTAKITEISIQRTRSICADTVSKNTLNAIYRWSRGPRGILLCLRHTASIMLDYFSLCQLVMPQNLLDYCSLALIAPGSSVIYLFICVFFLSIITPPKANFLCNEKATELTCKQARSNLLSCPESIKLPFTICTSATEKLA